MPVFEGLVPKKYSDIIQDMLFTLATWHAYAKLRLHTDQTLNFMDDTHRAMGFEVRRFASKVCPVFDTNDLPKEEAARGRRKRAMSSSAKKAKSVSKSTGRKKRHFRLDTYKWHALGHMVPSIRRIGTYENGGTSHVCHSLVYLLEILTWNAGGNGT